MKKLATILQNIKPPRDLAASYKKHNERCRALGLDKPPAEGNGHMYNRVRVSP